MPANWALTPFLLSVTVRYGTSYSTGPTGGRAGGQRGWRSYPRKRPRVPTMLCGKKVERVKDRGRYYDGDVKGLCLQVSESGAKSWLLRYQLNGKKRWMGLGSAADWSLKEARERARLARQKLSDGLDPLELKRAERSKQALAAARVLTFREAAAKYYEANASGWSNRKHAQQFINTLAQYVHPIIGTR